jgi:Ribbon-helix-helix protein, copG family
MPRGKPFARIAITLPVDDLDAADRLAVQQDRSRSWIVAEALRHYVLAQSSGVAQSPLGASRQAQLLRDLALTPLERVQAAEGVQLVGQRHLLGEIAESRVFDTFDDFLSWSRTRASAP